jgi:hypothetical protein
VRIALAEMPTVGRCVVTCRFPNVAKFARPRTEDYVRAKDFNRLA